MGHYSSVLTLAGRLSLMGDTPTRQRTADDDLFALVRAVTDHTGRAAGHRGLVCRHCHGTGRVGDGPTTAPPTGRQRPYLGTGPIPIIDHNSQ